MSTNRIGRINEDIERILASLLRDIKDPRVKKGIISITGVDTTADLKQSRIYLSVLGIDSEKEFKAGLKSASGYLRSALGKQLTLRHIPELIFVLDNSIERGARINEILNTLDIPDTDEDEIEIE